MNLPHYNDKTRSLSLLSNIGITKRNQQITSWLHRLSHNHGERSSPCAIRSACNLDVAGTNKNTNTNSSQEIHLDPQESISSSSPSIMMSPRTTKLLEPSPLSPIVAATITSATTTPKKSKHSCVTSSSDLPTSLLILLDIHPENLSAKEDETGLLVLSASCGGLPRRTSWNKKENVRFSCDRSVHFSSSVQCRFIESRRRMIKKSKSISESTTNGSTTRKSISTYWYDEEEMEVIHNELLDSVKQMRARESHLSNEGSMAPRLSSPDEEDPRDLCVRGLERFRRRDVMSDRSLQDRMDSIDSVLRLQTKMKRQNERSMDYTTIAQTYSRFSLRSQHLAIIRAKSDEAYVNQYVRQGSIAVE